jgi:uncharacterized protein YcfJ
MCKSVTLFGDYFYNATGGAMASLAESKLQDNPIVASKRKFKSVLTICALAALALAGEAAAQISFYEGEGFRGRVFSARGEVANLDRTGFNDRAMSVVVERGAWQICDDAYFRGHCEILRRGSYDSLAMMGMNNRISSVRPLGYESRYDNIAPIPLPKPLPQPTYEYRRRPTERLYEVPIDSVRAVLGQPDRRCWVERQQVSESSGGEPNVGGAIIGGIIGGVLGHQVGGGRGKDVATAIGALGGAAIGNNAGRDGGGNVTYDRDVRRCETTSSGRPEYWDVSYQFRGVEHRLQMNTPPGRTITVNQRGEPRL